MGRVQLKITPSLASMFHVSRDDWFILNQEIGEGATIGDLFTTLAASYTNFRKVVFDTDEGKASDQIMIILNDSLLQGDVMEVKIKDGDTVTLLPVYSGG